MGNTVATSNTHVANASGKPLRVYYSVDKMRLEEMVTEVKGELTGKTAGVSGGATMKFRLDSRIRFIRIPVDEYIKISGEGALYVSVFVESCECSDECLKAISVNFYIPSDRSFIITRNHSLKFQRYAANIWVDDDGYRHR